MTAFTCSVCLEDIENTPFNNINWCVMCKKLNTCFDCLWEIIKKEVNYEMIFEGNPPPCPCCRTPLYKLVHYHNISKIIDEREWCRDVIEPCERLPNKPIREYVYKLYKEEEDPKTYKEWYEEYFYKC